MSSTGQWLTPEEKQNVLRWLQQFRFSSPIRKLSRDLSDGVLVAEMLHQIFPRLVELHNYTKGFAPSRKLDNWDTLNRKVFKKLEIELTPDVLQAIVGQQDGAVEAVLMEIMIKVQRIMANQ
ncbi:sperm flagellar protein 1-like [Uranotaenia lowii]|uniref:sperm flagellar protein 1-like n=1 Tax=Uranotaenia lowii TaxID=190385 RepID=UPI00247AF98D|nr:sperm flagellar protein 1-like [Uranotaenia lowii]